MSSPYIGPPETFGTRPDGHCGHCGGRPEHAVDSEHGRFCFACFRWQTWIGPDLAWGDGMAPEYWSDAHA